MRDFVIIIIVISQPIKFPLSVGVWSAYNECSSLPTLGLWGAKWFIEQPVVYSSWVETQEPQISASFMKEVPLYEELSLHSPYLWRQTPRRCDRHVPMRLSEPDCMHMLIASTTWRERTGIISLRKAISRQLSIGIISFVASTRSSRGQTATRSSTKTTATSTATRPTRSRTPSLGRTQPWSSTIIVVKPAWLCQDGKHL